MDENNPVDSSDDVMREIAKKKLHMYESLSKDEFGNVVNCPGNLKIYLDFQLDLIRLKVEKEEKERIFKAQEAERIHRCDDEFWLNILNGAWILRGYIALTKENNVNSSNPDPKKE